MSKKTLVDRAIEFAVLAHGSDTRKGSSTPYITHPFGVAILLAQQGCSEEVIAAGLLHDVIEDTRYKEGDIRARFEDSVADIVNGCSEPDRDKKSWEERKEHTHEALKTACLDVKMVTCADKLQNLRSMVADYEAEGEDLWNRFNRGKEKQAWYYRGIVKSLLCKTLPDGGGHAFFQTLNAEVEEFFGRRLGIPPTCGLEV